jgi:ferritin
MQAIKQQIERVIYMNDYVTEKIEVLKDFGVILDNNQLLHIESLSSEVAIDNYVRPIIYKNLS